MVCVVDAEAGGGQLGRHEEARAQVEAADRILLTKLDLASPTRWWRCTGSWRSATRPRSGRASRQRRGDRRAGPLAAGRAGPRAPRRGHAPTRTRMRTDSWPPSTYNDAAPLLAEPLLAVVESLGPALVRAKGFVHLAGEPRRGFLERAGLRTTLQLGEPWGTDPAHTELVLIGEDLDDGAIRRQIWPADHTSPQYVEQ